MGTITKEKGPYDTFPTVSLRQSLRLTLDIDTGIPFVDVQSKPLQMGKGDISPMCSLKKAFKQDRNPLKKALKP